MRRIRAGPSDLRSGGIARLKLLGQRDEANEKLYRTATGYAAESVAAVRTVAALNREDDVVKTFGATLPSSRSSVLVGTILHAVLSATSFFAVATVLWYGARQVSSGDVGIQQLFTCLSASVFAVSS